MKRYTHLTIFERETLANELLINNLSVITEQDDRDRVIPFYLYRAERMSAEEFRKSLDLIKYT